jgi:hypothetical protein
MNITKGQLTEDAILKYWKELKPKKADAPMRELSLREAAEQALLALEYFKVLTVQVDKAFTNRAIAELASALERTTAKKKS